MTDKQIIIDVCPYQGECSVSGCKRNDDGCFVRQLFEERNRAENQIIELNKTIKAKEQKCEELSFDNFDLKDQLTDLKFKYKTINDVAKSFEQKLQAERKQLDQLKAENDELKRQHQGDKGLITSTGKMNYQLLQEYDKLKAENEVLQKDLATIDAVKDTVIAQYKQLKQTLTEIKEILQANKEELNECLYNDIDGQILQKISEVEE